MVDVDQIKEEVKDETSKVIDQTKETLQNVTQEVSETAQQLQTDILSGLKAGYKTTEFWIAIGSFIVGMLMVFGIVGPDKVDTIMAVVNKIIGGILSAVPNLVYIWSRGKVKSTN